MGIDVLVAEQRAMKDELNGKIDEMNGRIDALVTEQNRTNEKGLTRRMEGSMPLLPSRINFLLAMAC